MSGFAPLLAHFGIPGMNLPIYNEHLYEAKDICVVTGKTLPCYIWFCHLGQ